MQGYLQGTLAHREKKIQMGQILLGAVFPGFPLFIFVTTESALVKKKKKKGGAFGSWQITSLFCQLDYKCFLTDFSGGTAAVSTLGNQV